MESCEHFCVETFVALATTSHGTRHQNIASASIQRLGENTTEALCPGEFAVAEICGGPYRMSLYKI